jgi:hypothetical protein
MGRRPEDGGRGRRGGSRGLSWRRGRKSAQGDQGWDVGYRWCGDRWIGWPDWPAVAHPPPGTVLVGIVEAGPEPCSRFDADGRDIAAQHRELGAEGDGHRGQARGAVAEAQRVLIPEELGEHAAQVPFSSGHHSGQYGRDRPGCEQWAAAATVGQHLPKCPGQQTRLKENGDTITLEVDA